MATLHLMVGLPGSGKTTEAKRLERELPALRLTPDEWHLRLFGDDFHTSQDSALHDQRHSLVEALMWETAQRVLQLGSDVILDYGFWAREERDALRNQARALGVGFCIHYMACPREVLLARLRQRNEQAGALPVFRVHEEDIDCWSRIFQPPTPEELEQTF